MSFDKYFAATEDAFKEEQNEFVQKANTLRERWDDITKTDQKTVQLVKELSQLKTLLRRGHLQVLRTKEECLHMKLRNAQLSFQVRQLQAEVKRFLPYTNIKSEPSTEYQLSIDKTEQLNEDEKLQQHLAADDKLMKESQGLLEEWKNVTKLQERVFSEETELQRRDDEQFKLFSDDYNKQNEETHRILDSVHADILKKFIILQRSSGSLHQSKTTSIKSLQAKINSLENELKNIDQKLEVKLDKSKKKMSKVLDASKKNLHESIKRQEGINAAAQIEAMKVENQLNDDIDFYTNSIRKLQKRQKRLETKNEESIKETNESIQKLEAQMNALYTAATRIAVVPIDEHNAIVNTVANAIDTHANAARCAEQMEMRVQYLSDMMKKLVTGIDTKASTQ